MQPSASAQVGVPFVQQPVVQLQDVLGNPVTEAGTEITAALASGPGGTLIGDVTATTDAGGLAVFTDLAITGTVGDYTLSFTGIDLTGAASRPAICHWAYCSRDWHVGIGPCLLCKRGLATGRDPTSGGSRGVQPPGASGRSMPAYRYNTPDINVEGTTDDRYSIPG